jgi:uncharacterized RDD family membrane protein YckC
MKRAVYRALFASGIVVFITLTYFNFSLSPDQYEQFLHTGLSTALFLLFAFSLMFYLYAIVHSCFDIVSSKRSFMLAWVLFVLCVPILGSYLYFEKYLLEPRISPRPDILPSTKDKSPAYTDSAAGWARIVAAIIDLAIVALVLGLYARWFGSPSAGGEYQVRGFHAAIVLIIVWLTLFPVMEFSLRGTIGKKILGLRVIMIDGSRLTFVSALKRHLLDIIDLVFVVWMVPVPRCESKSVQRLGDKWAKTRVVRVAKISEPDSTID